MARNLLYFVPAALGFAAFTKGLYARLKESAEVLQERLLAMPDAAPAVKAYG